MKRRLLHHARRALLFVSYVALATKLLIPIGYMPAAWSDGAPIRLCDSWFTLELPVDHETHHDHGDHGDDDIDPRLFKHCSLGALSAASAVPSEFRLQLAESPEYPIVFARVEHSFAAPSVGFRPRAPPR